MREIESYKSIIFAFYTVFQVIWARTITVAIALAHGRTILTNKAKVASAYVGLDASPIHTSLPAGRCAMLPGKRELSVKFYFVR